MLDLGRGERPAPTHLVEHPGDQLGLLAGDAHHAAPGEIVRLGHPPSEQRLQVDGDQRRLMPPELEQLTRLAVGRAVEQLGRVRTQAAVKRHVVGPLQHVDRVHLDQVQPAQHSPQVAQVGGATRFGVGEALRGQRDAAGLRHGEGLGHGHEQNLMVGYDRIAVCSSLR